MEQNDFNQEQQHPEQQQKKSPSTGTKITVLVILIVLLAVGILLPVKLVPNAFSSLSSSITSFFTGKETVTLSTDRQTINSGEAFTLSWTGKHKTNGTYALSYDCTTGVQLTTSINQPNETIACGNNYYFTPNDNNVDLTATANSARFTDINLTLGFLENGSSTVETLGTTTVTITNPAIDSGAVTATSTSSVSNQPATSTTSTNTQTSPAKPKPSTPASTPKYNPTPTASNPYGLADLEVRPMATGYLSSNGTFIPSTTVAANQEAAVKFDIVNVGNKNTGTWTFTINIPSQTDPRYDSGIQQNLGPGDRIEYVLGFMNLNSSTNNLVTITADPSNYIIERTKTNNTAVMNIVNSQYTTISGKPNLVVHMLDTGIIDRSTNNYSVTSVANAGDRVGVRFQIQNVGTLPTGSWQFSASLPTADSSISNYTSGYQDSLNPGETKTFTLAFETLRNQGSNTITVTADPSNQVNESNESDNTSSINMSRN